MAFVPVGFVQQDQLTGEITRAIRALNPAEVVHVVFSIGTDSTDDPALFFRIILTDAASREDSLAEVTGRVQSTLFEAIHPIEKWGLTPYFSFRSVSEQNRLQDRDWM